MISELKIQTRSILFAASISLLVTACGASPTADMTQEDQQKRVAGEARPLQPSASLPESVEMKTNADQPLMVIAKSFAAAILDGKRKTDTPIALLEKVGQGLGGMHCTPTAIASMTSNVDIKLPEDRAARNNVFAVLTPERGAYAIYYPYDLNEPAEDYIIPSDQINWQRASEKSDFSVQPQLFDGVKMGSEDRFQIFLENGYYKFALLRKSLPENADAIRSADNVIAACIIHYTGS